jgi:hypothetical protein
MRVIEGPKEWKTTADCKRCTAKLEVGMDDVTVGEFGGGYCESGDVYVYVSCCVCGTDIKLGLAYNMPVLVKKRAEENYRNRKR